MAVVAARAMGCAAVERVAAAVGIVGLEGNAASRAREGRRRTEVAIAGAVGVVVVVVGGAAVEEAEEGGPGQQSIS